MRLNVKEMLKTYSFGPTWLRRICEHSQPILSLMQKRELYYKDKLLSLVQDDLYGTLPAPHPVGRNKRFAALVIPALAGLVTLAVESVSGYLQRK